MVDDQRVQALQAVISNPTSCLKTNGVCFRFSNGLKFLAKIDLAKGQYQFLGQHFCVSEAAESYRALTALFCAAARMATPLPVHSPAALHSPHSLLSNSKTLLVFKQRRGDPTRPPSSLLLAEQHWCRSCGAAGRDRVRGPALLHH